MAQIDRSQDRNNLRAFAKTVKARDQISRDRCGDWMLQGREGTVYSVGIGRIVFQMVFIDHATANWWNLTKRDLAFCQVTQDGDCEGVLRLERLPYPNEGEVMRKRLALPRRRSLTPEQRQAVSERLAPFRFKRK